MDAKGFWCLVSGGGAWRTEASDYVPGPTPEEWANDPRRHDGKPPPTGYFRTYTPRCQRCGRDIHTHL